MYPLDERSRGPTVRISHLAEELSHLVDLDVVAGYRGGRRVELARYAASGRLRGLDGIYVESSTFLPAEADLAFLALARGLGIGVVTYVRDAYQLFPREYPASSLRQRLGVAVFRPMLRALRAVSTRLAFPTRGLADAVIGPDAGADALLLPPGAPPPVAIAREPGANRLLYVGDARLAAQGVGRLLEAVQLARDADLGIELNLVTRAGGEPRPPHPAWLHLHHAEDSAIHALLPRVAASVIPRPRSAYNDLAMPIKLFDYLSYGRPLLVTDCIEQARVVADGDAGVVSADDPAAMATAIAAILRAPGEQLERWAVNAHRLAGEASWGERAARIVAVLGKT